MNEPKKMTFVYVSQELADKLTTESFRQGLLRFGRSCPVYDLEMVA